MVSCFQCCRETMVVSLVGLGLCARAGETSVSSGGSQPSAAVS
jgi:hypothetical protein|eukprot:COSAG06_NODE_2124_length_7540_cov_3.145794_7_plen_43_part_00